ncbi:GNAT family protein [Haladaptatus sp. DJG-WS-42]|uniref:GNAT family N-acetyltransferase n=1 Tax=Haladaptatus sp. DJG-WS-42 TaxID=3120516 RepID=UPI0030D3A754
MSHLFPEQIETERLVLRRLSMDNLSVREFYDICKPSPEMEAVTKYMPWKPHATMKPTREFMARREKLWNDGEEAAYFILPREGEDGAGQFAGTATLHCDWERRVGGLGTWLRKDYWGRGYSGERAAALMQLAFDRLDLAYVKVTHHTENDKSKRAVEKYVEAHGGRRDATLRNWLPYEDHVSDQVYYSVSQSQWREAVEGRKKAEYTEVIDHAE